MMPGNTLDDTQLQNRYEKLLAEYQQVVAENLALKSQLGIRVPSPSETPSAQSATHHHSEICEKIALFRSLFRGREDVYAQRWQSASGEKSGYSPVCKNEWVSGVCLKPKQKCQDCRSRELRPLTDDVIEKHLRGADPHCRDVIGIYPMLQDETTYFLAVDFDDTGWENDATSFICTCREFKIDAALAIAA